MTTGFTTPATAAPKSSGTGPEPRLRRAAQDFEAVFLAQILKGLSAGLRGEGPLGGDGPFADMLLDSYARLVSRAGGVGIAAAVMREMLHAQGLRP